MSVLSTLLTVVLERPADLIAAVAAASASVGWLKNLIFNRNQTRLATVKSAAATIAGKIVLEAANVKDDESLKDFLNRRIHEEARAANTEFAETAVKIGLDHWKMASMIAGAIGNNPSLSALVPTMERQS